jgi:hypothetical protein
LREEFSLQLPARYSATVISRPRPETSWNPAFTVVSLSPSQLTRKLNWLYG